MNAYLEAPKTVLPLPVGRLTASSPADWPQFLEVVLDEAKCDARPVVTFRYSPTPVPGNFTRSLAIERRSPVEGQTRIFAPVFEQFEALEVSGDRPGCLVGVNRFTDLAGVPLLLGAILPPDWKTLPWYQRLADWESGPAGPDGRALTLTEPNPDAIARAPTMPMKGAR